MKLKPNETKLVIVLAVVTAVSTLMVLFTKISDFVVSRDSVAPLKTTANRPNSNALPTALASGASLVVRGQPSRKLVGNAKSIYVLPLGNFRKTHIEAFLKEYRKKIKGNFIVLEPLNKNFENPSRQQDNSYTVLNSTCH